MPALSTIAIAAAATAAVSGGAAAYGAHQQGQAASRSASVQAEMQRRKGKQEFALAQERAAEERDAAESLQSLAIAQSAAFGAGTQEKATIDKILDIEQRGEYNALSQLYDGSQRQQDLNYGAELTTFQGRSARRAGNMQAFSTILDTAVTMGIIAAQGGAFDSPTPNAKAKTGSGAGKKT